jgi:hypothetical protein
MNTPDQWVTRVDEESGEPVTRLRVDTPTKWSCWTEDGVAWHTYTWDDGRGYSMVSRLADRRAHEQLVIPGVAAVGAGER